MSTKYMLLPAKDRDHFRLVSLPEHIEEHEAFRHATALIASVEEQNPDCDWEDLLETLEAHGFEQVNFMLGPELS